METKYSQTVSFKLSLQERNKLDMLAQRTHRHISQVLRLLVAHAEIADGPDIQVTPVAAKHIEAGTIED